MKVYVTEIGAKIKSVNWKLNDELYVTEEVALSLIKQGKATEKKVTKSKTIEK